MDLKIPAMLAFGKMEGVGPVSRDRRTPERRSFWFAVAGVVVLAACVAGGCSTASPSPAACNAGNMPAKKLPGCASCLAEHCCSSANRCNANSECNAVATCVFECPSADPRCAWDCESGHTADGVGDYVPLATCAETECPLQCGSPGTLIGAAGPGTVTVGTGGAGGEGGGASGGGVGGASAGSR